MWLFERLCLVAPPEHPLSAVPNFFSHYFFSVVLDIESWENWFVENGYRNLYWPVPWWGQLLPVLELGEYSYVRLVGLRHTSFYFPWQLLRQFG